MPAPTLTREYDFIAGPLAKAGTADRALAECPECDRRFWLDSDQYRGAVSIVCPTENCTYHETCDLRAQADDH
jgi:hypothetical protein